MKDLYIRQKRFNEFLKRNIDKDKLEWTLTFVQGLQLETAELLQHIDWHPNWKGFSREDRTSIALELADITKYLLCLWQEYDFSYKEMIQWLHIKSDIIDTRGLQKFQPPPKDRTVLFVDLDGTIADWRGGFLNWLRQHQSRLVTGPDPLITLSMDLDFSWSYALYSKYKEAFEWDGGYAHLPPFLDAIELFAHWQAIDPPPYIVICTARPVHIARVYHDTFQWLRLYNIQFQELHLVGDERVQLAMEMQKHNKVIMFEDNPELAMRAAANELHVVMRAFPYNESTQNYFIHRTNDFSTLKGLI